MSVTPISRLREAEKQVRIVADRLEGDDLPEGFLDDLGTTGERLRRLIHALEREQPEFRTDGGQDLDARHPHRDEDADDWLDRLFGEDRCQS